MERPAAVCFLCGKPPSDHARSVVIVVGDRYPLRVCESCIRLLYLMVTTPIRHLQA